MRRSRFALWVVVAVALTDGAEAQTTAASSDGGALALPLCTEAPLLAHSKKVEADALTCLPLRKRWKKASYVHLNVKLGRSGHVDEVRFDGEPLAAAEESCLRAKVAAWKLPMQRAACRYDGFLLQVPVPAPAACKPSPRPPPAPELERPFRLGLAMDADGYVLASPNRVLPPGTWDELAEQLAEIRRTFPDQFNPEMQFLVVKRSSTPDSWVDDLMRPLWLAGVRRAAIRVDDALTFPAEGCFGTEKDVMAWRALFKSLAPTDFQQVDGRAVKSFSSPSQRPPIVGKELDTLALLCGVIPRTPPDLHNGLVTAHCAKLASCAGECAAEFLAFSKGEQISSLASCKAFEAVKAQCSPLHPPSCAHRFVRERLLGAIAATVKATPALPSEIAKQCRAAGLLP